MALLPHILLELKATPISMVARGEVGWSGLF